MANVVREQLHKAVLIIALMLASVPVAADELESLEKLVGQWIELRQQINKTRDQWQTEKQLLENELKLIGSELGQLTEHQAELESNLQEEQQKIQQLQDKASAREKELSELSDAVEEYSQRLHQNFQESQALAVRNSESVSEQLSQLLEQLLTVHEASRSVRLENEVLTDPQGTPRKMTVLHIGFAAAFAVSADTERAALGRFRSGDWEWQWDNAWAQPVRRAVKIFQQERAAGFVRLPLKVEDAQ